LVLSGAATGAPRVADYRYLPVSPAAALPATTFVSDFAYIELPPPPRLPSGIVWAERFLDAREPPPPCELILERTVEAWAFAHPELVQRMLTALRGPTDVEPRWNPLDAELWDVIEFERKRWREKAAREKRAVAARRRRAR
jgi:hypothetical protein